MTSHHSRSSNILLQKLSRARRTLYQLLLYAVFVGLGSIFALDILSLAWTHRPWGIAKHVLRGMVGILSLDAATFYYFPTGVFAGLMAVLLLDSYKRAQGVILWGGIAAGSVVVLLSKGLLIGPLIDGFGPISAAFGLLGVSVGLLLGGVRPSRFDRLGGEREFPEAPRRLFSLALLVVAYGVVEAVVVYNSPLVWVDGRFVVQLLTVEGLNLSGRIILDVVMSGLGVAGLYKFISYENHTKMILIGPQRSGKSASFGGLQLAVRDLIDEQAGIKSNSHVAGLSDVIANGEFPDATVREDPVPLEINYRTGGLFPEKRTIQSVDYAGELLPEILEPVIENPAKADGGQVYGDEESDDEDDENDVPSIGDLVGGDDSDSATEYRPAKSWDEATQRIYETDRANAGPAIWDCIRHADRVIMAIPLDDFITPIIERGNWPDYQPIETFADDMTPEEIREEYDVPYEANLYRYGDGYYYFADEPDRASPTEYLTWYRDLAREFRNDKEFVLAGTMADWATKDFERESPQGKNPLVESNYVDFCRHVYERIMLEENANMQDLFAATGDDQIHLLWYPIANTERPEGEEDYRIDTSTVSAVKDDHQTLLNGAKQFIDRLNR